MTNATALLSLGVSIALMSVAQLVLKARFLLLGHSGEAAPGLWETVQKALADPLIWLAGGLIGVGACCWYLAMLRLPISLMLPLAGLIAPIVSLGAWLMLGESLTPAKFAAILVIAAGAAWLGWLNS